MQRSKRSLEKKTDAAEKLLSRVMAINIGLSRETNALVASAHGVEKSGNDMEVFVVS